MTPTTRRNLGFLSSTGCRMWAWITPQGHRDSIPPVLAVTAPDLAVVRLHGHWTSGTKDIHERFGYRYSDGELAEWAPRIRIRPTRGHHHVLFNNCYRDYARSTRSSSPLCSIRRPGGGAVAPDQQRWRPRRPGRRGRSRGLRGRLRRPMVA
jgi:hypothetical protein